MSIQESVFKEDNPSRTVLRMRALARLGVLYGFSGRIPIYLVTEFPKSGGTWFAKMLSDLIEVPFPPPVNWPRFSTMILRDTRRYSPCFKNVAVMMRDGRDIMVSAYYHFLFDNEANVHYAVERRRKLLNFADLDDIENNLPRFITYMFEEYPRDGWSTPFNWAMFVDSWIDRQAPIIRYEDLLNDPVNSLERTISALIGHAPPRERIAEVVEKYSFAKLSGRKPGQENKNSFARKGIAGDWKNNFNRESCELFDQYAGEQLIKLGYEPDRDWVRRHLEGNTTTARDVS